MHSKISGIHSLFYFELLIRYRPSIDIKELLWYQKSAARTRDKVETESPPSRAELDKIFSTATLRRDVLSVPTSTSLHPRHPFPIPPMELYGYDSLLSS